MNKKLLILPVLMLGGTAACFAHTNVKAPFTQTAQEKAETGTLIVNMSNGSFTAISESKKYAAHWKSTQTNPTVDIDCGKNNIDISASNTNGNLQAWIGKDGSCNYTITVSDGWNITGYSMDVTLANANQPVTVRTADGQEFEIGTEATHISVSGIGTNSTLFTLIGGNYGVNLDNFTLNYAAAGTVDEQDLRTFTVFDTRNSEVPYRIPAIGKAQNGHLVAVADYRYSKGDIGTGKLDLRLRRSTDGGKTWGDIITPEIFRGDGLDANGKEFSSSTSLESKGRHDKCAYGDPCIVGDRTSPRMMITSCSGYPGFGQGDNTYHQGWARWYSDDNGVNWTGPEYLDEKFVYEPLRKAGHNIHGFFIGSGKIHQSRYIKKDNYYRLYCAGISQTSGSKENWVLYSDDFGETWQFLGGTKTSPVPGGDEPKVEELPNGNVIISSRTPYGRYYNIYTFSEPLDGESGAWATKAISNSSVGGLDSGDSFGTNGEIQIMPVVRKQDGQKTFLALQSLPTVNGRANVKIFYKDLGETDTYENPTNFAKNWDGNYQVSTTSSSYSTWCLQDDNAIGMLYEENSYNNGFDIVYKHLTVETITSGEYSFDADYKYEQKDVDFELATRNRQMQTLIDNVETAAAANSKYTEGEKLVTSASQLECPWGCKEQKPANATDTNWSYDIFDIDNLIDENPDTYYHTVWQNGDVTPGTHYLDVTANDTFEGMIEVKVTRRKAATDHVNEFSISGTNDGSTFEQVATVEMPNAVSGGESEAQFSIPSSKSYKKLRFTVTSTVSERGYWHMAEFQLYPIRLDENCPNAKVADAYNELMKAIDKAKETVGKATEDDIADLQTAYDAYQKALDKATGITSVKAEKPANNRIYDILGRRVAKASKGIYIVNGKKELH